MTLTSIQTFIIISMVTLGTVITRFLPFILFPDNKGNHPYITYLGNVLPYSAIGLLVVYCLKGVNLMNSHLGFQRQQPLSALRCCIIGKAMHFSALVPEQSSICYWFKLFLYKSQFQNSKPLRHKVSKTSKFSFTH